MKCTFLARGVAKDSAAQVGEKSSSVTCPAAPGTSLGMEFGNLLLFGHCDHQPWANEESEEEDDAAPSVSVVSSSAPRRQGAREGA